jgi:hypothetical protein
LLWNLKVAALRQTAGLSFQEVDATSLGHVLVLNLTPCVLSHRSVHVLHTVPSPHKHVEEVLKASQAGTPESFLLLQG